ncbi:MAG: tyrosine recombinase XerC [Deltaproteobacteria bacterium]|nr:tyrosine recombinase XerC [Deltaproteobacteria bacterium]MBI3296013.1 tyrosine recombinase XerC [Deltaproteobacteria bacterium]
MAGNSLFDGPIPDTIELVNGFVEYLKTEKSASHHTIINYEIDLRQFIKFLGERCGPKIDFDRQLTLKLLREFLGEQMKKYERATVARRLSLVKSFMKYLHQEGYVEKNLARLIRLPRPHLKLPHTLRPEEVVRLIEQVPIETLMGKRLKAVLELLYSAGVRISELVGLNYADIDLPHNQIRVFGKGSRERLVPVGLHCRAAVGEYIKAIPTFQKRGKDTPLFLNRDGERITVRTLQRQLQAYAIESLGPKGALVTPHTFRHSCATHLLSAGAGLREIQELLGHRTLVTTQKYTHMDIERLKNSYRRAHPRENRRKKEAET